MTLDVPGHFEHEILCYEVKAGSLIAGRDMAQAGLPGGSQVMAVMRDGKPQPLQAGATFSTGDYVYLLAQPENLAQLRKLFDPHLEPVRLEARRYFGSFVLNGEAVAGELAAVYGFAVPEEVAQKTLAQYLAEAFHGRVVIGDSVRMGGAELVVREIEGGKVTRVGLRLR